MPIGAKVTSSLVICCGLLAGCAAQQDVADPNRITLKDAMISSIDALEAAHQKSIDDHTHFGYYGCTLTTVFNVSATGTQDNKLALTASGPPASVFPISFGGSASTEATASGTRGNTVTLVLATPYCLPEVKAQAASGASRGKSASAAGATVAPKDEKKELKPTPVVTPNGPKMYYPPPTIQFYLHDKSDIKISPDLLK